MTRERERTTEEKDEKNEEDDPESELEHARHHPECDVRFVDDVFVAAIELEMRAIVSG
jgi:hypothetical protein